MLVATDFFSRDEIKTLTTRSNFRAVLEVAHTWGYIAVAFALPAAWPHPLSYFVSIWVLGGKQLACAIIMHDASHDVLFRTRRLNAWMGNLFGGYWLFNSLGLYRPYHLLHHTRTGHSEDPDLPLTKPYPCSRASLARKFSRDLAGITGVKAYIALFAMLLGFWNYSLGGTVEKLPRPKMKTILGLALERLAWPLVAHATMFAVLWTVGHPALYILWWVAALTTFQFCLRVRSMAEHSMSPDRLDDFRNTRTTRANWLTRILFAPHNVNFHLEHHLLMTVPPYRLPEMHALLKERGFFERGLFATGYAEVIGGVIRNDGA